MCIRDRSRGGLETFSGTSRSRLGLESLENRTSRSHLGLERTKLKRIGTARRRGLPQVAMHSQLQRLAVIACCVPLWDLMVVAAEVTICVTDCNFNPVRCPCNEPVRQVSP